MKQKEKWSKEYSAFLSNLGETLPEAWLAGFEFARQKIKEIESIELSPWLELEIRTLGEEEVND